MARMKFLCDADRCIECNACVTACKNEHEVPWGINRRRSRCICPSCRASRLAEGKLPLCAEMCSTKSLLAGDGEIIAQIYKERVTKRGYGSGAWGWKTAYKETIAT